ASSTFTHQCHDIRLTFQDTATTKHYTLSLHDALPIYEITPYRHAETIFAAARDAHGLVALAGTHNEAHVLSERDYIAALRAFLRSEEHTSELQSRENLVCRLLLDKKKIKQVTTLDTQI